MRLALAARARPSSVPVTRHVTATARNGEGGALRITKAQAATHLRSLAAERPALVLFTLPQMSGETASP